MLIAQQGSHTDMIHCISMCKQVLYPSPNLFPEQIIHIKYFSLENKVNVSVQSLGTE